MVGVVLKLGIWRSREVLVIMEWEAIWLPKLPVSLPTNRQEVEMGR